MEGWDKEWHENSENSNGWADTLLELIYQSYTEFNSMETPEFKAIVNPLDRTLRALVDTDEEADEYMNIVFELCTAYERQSYIEGMKVGARLMGGVDGDVMETVGYGGRCRRVVWSIE